MADRAPTPLEEWQALIRDSLGDEPEGTRCPVCRGRLRSVQHLLNHVSHIHPTARLTLIVTGVEYAIEAIEAPVNETWARCALCERPQKRFQALLAHLERHPEKFEMQVLVNGEAVQMERGFPLTNITARRKRGPSDGGSPKAR